MRRSFVSMNIEYDVHCASKLLQVWQEHCNKAILTRDIWEPVKWATSSQSWPLFRVNASENPLIFDADALYPVSSLYLPLVSIQLRIANPSALLLH